MSGPVAGTAFPLVADDGGRLAAGFTEVTDKDCVTRSIAIGTGLPYEQILDMVNKANEELGGPAGNTAQTGAYGLVTAKLMYELGWRDEADKPQRSAHTRRLRGAARQVRGTRRGNRIFGPPVQGVSTATCHVTAIRDRKVHDLASMGAAGYARTDRVKAVFGRPPEYR
jgi:hypothetical protein